VHSTEYVPLLVLCQCDSWEARSARIETIPAQAAIEEMHKQEPEGRTAFAIAVVSDFPVELLESMVELGNQNTKELCGPTPDWTIRAKLAKDKKDKEDAA